MNKESEKALQNLKNSIESARIVLLEAELLCKNVEYQIGLDPLLELDDVMRKVEIPINVWSAYKEFHKIYKGWEA